MIRQARKSFCFCAALFFIVNAALVSGSVEVESVPFLVASENSPGNNNVTETADVIKIPISEYENNSAEERDRVARFTTSYYSLLYPIVKSLLRRSGQDCDPVACGFGIPRENLAVLPINVGAQEKNNPGNDNVNGNGAAVLTSLILLSSIFVLEFGKFITNCCLTFWKYRDQRKRQDTRNGASSTMVP